jgi:two-component system NtrC family response regulator
LCTPAVKERKAGAVANQTIVVVNDDSDYLTMIKDVLEDEGYAHVCCGTGKGAIELIKCTQPDVILLDVHVGIEAEIWRALDYIRLDPATKDTPVLICTTDPRLPEAKAAWLKRQHCTVLQKPFTIEDLLAMLEPIIGPAARER